MVFSGHKVSPLPRSAMFTTQAYDPVISLVSVLVGALIFYAWFFTVQSGELTEPSLCLQTTGNPE
jgi:hypothetical protein